jgi:site-specific DNA-methyltransferase (adenine-specific)
MKDGRKIIGVSNRGSGASPQKLNNHEHGDTGIGILDGSGKTFYLTEPATDAAKEWSGYGTALKPAHEPICVARKPIEGTVAANVQKHGTGALNIDGCRIGWPEGKVPEIGTSEWGGPQKKLSTVPDQKGDTVERTPPSQLGRWPANLIHDGSDEVLDTFPSAPGQCADVKYDADECKTQNVYGAMKRGCEPSAKRTYEKNGSTNFAMKPGARRLDSGSAARFFYTAKTSKAEREAGCEDLTLVPLAYGNQAQAEVKRGNTEHAGKSGINTVKMRGNNHPTVKPQSLMRYLCRLVTPLGGVVLDPFMGSGSTGLAAIHEGFSFIGVEINESYVAIARARLIAEVLS